MPETPSISHAASAPMLAMTSLATRTEPNDPLLPMLGMLPPRAHFAPVAPKMRNQARPGARFDQNARNECSGGLGALHVGLAPRVYSDQIAGLDEQRRLDHGAGFELGRLRGAGNRVAFEARVGLDHTQLDVDRQLDPDELALIGEQVGWAAFLQ